MKYRHLYVLILPALLLSLSSCAILTCPDCGRLTSNRQVGYQFQSLQILPDHRYYYSGEILEPDAIIAIHQDYVLENGFWTEVQPTVKQLKEWMWMFSTVEDIYDEDDRMTINYEGAVIVDLEGRQAGVYYSKYHNTVVRFPGKNRIRIYKPGPPWIFHILLIR